MTDGLIFGILGPQKATADNMGQNSQMFFDMSRMMYRGSELAAIIGLCRVSQ
jgi:hypothetical protein